MQLIKIDDILSIIENDNTEIRNKAYIFAQQSNIKNIASK